MPRARTHSFKGKMFSEIPDEIVRALGVSDRDELEFREIAKGVVAVYKAGDGPEDERQLAEEEIDVIRKVNRIYSSDRTAEKIRQVLSEQEHKVFQDLLARKVFFTFNKNGRRVVGLDKRYLPLVLVPEKKEGGHGGLFEKGYMIIDNEHEAELLSSNLTREGKDDEVRGVRGFDQKYYVVTKEKLSEMEWRLLSSINGRKTLEQVAEELKEDPLLVKACAEVLKEEGKLIEKKKGVYDRV